MYREIYRLLYKNKKRDLAFEFLQKELIHLLHTEISFAQLEEQLHKDHQKVLNRYENYTKKNEILFFHTKKSIQWFLLQIAPTKMIDGIWLSTINSANCDKAVKDILCKIYIEECGDNDPDLNHVNVFRKLFESVFTDFKLQHEDDWIDESLIKDESFRSGCIQMALALRAEDYLPELVGYNLGYEQLPFHMLVTRDELAKFNFDPYYFTLHISIDNFHTGHAQMALKVAKLLIQNDNRNLQRIISGMNLSNIGIDTEQMMMNYSVKDHLEAILRSKCEVSSEIHCRMKELYKSMKDPEKSLVDALKNDNLLDTFLMAISKGGCMYKCFDTDELQVIKSFAQTEKDIQCPIRTLLLKNQHHHKKVHLNGVPFNDLLHQDWTRFETLIKLPETKKVVKESLECGGMKFLLNSTKTQIRNFLDS